MPEGFSFLFIDDCASVCETLAYQAKALGDQVTLLLHRRGLTTYRQLDDDTYYIDTTRLTPTIRTIPELMRIRKYDAVIVSSRVGWATGAIIKGIFGTKMITVLHGSDIRRLAKVSLPKREMLRLALKRSNYVFYASLDLELLTRNMGRPYSRLKYPIDTQIFSQKGEAIPLDGTPSVFVPTRLDADKGFSRIGNLVAHVLKNYPKSKIYAVRWPGTDSVLNALKLNDINRVELVDFMTRTSLPKYYRGASVVIGQMHLGFGSMTECEAMSCGVPVVFYDKYYGYGCLDRNEETLRNFFDAVVSDDDFRRDRVSFGRRLIEEAYDSRKVFSSFKDVVAQVTKAGAGQYQTPLGEDRQRRS